MQNTCENCGDEYEVTTFPPQNSRFCSQDCKLDHKRVTIACQHCGDEHTLQRWRVQDGQRYCSRECYNADVNAETTNRDSKIRARLLEGNPEDFGLSPIGERGVVGGD